ncbi:MAG TPA: tetratricopeptide repeat protein [Vulgatibacter sp.]|nr:tetratricopeptide repeat protein [Vulgatibacter sp.]
MDKNKFTQAAAKLVQKGQLDKAIAEYQKARKADPKDVRILLKIGELQQKKGDNLTAAATLLEVAKSYAADGFFLKAVAVYKQIVKLDPDRIEVNLELAELYQQLGLLSDAMGQLRIVANHHEKAGNAADALDVLRRMVDLDPDNVGSRIKLGELFAQQGQTQDALRELRVSAVHLRSHGRMDDYVRVGERIVSLAPDDLALSRELAALHLGRKDPRRALVRLQVNFTADPHDVATLDLLARAFQELGQIPKTISVYKELARVHREANRLDEERAVWRKVLELAPDDPDAAVAFVRAPEAPARPAPAATPAEPHPRPTLAPSSGPARAAAAARVSGGPKGSKVSKVSGGPVAGRSGGPAKAAPPGEKEKLPKLLTEIDVYLKYGLNEKAAAHVALVLQLDPTSLDGLERAVQVRTAVGDSAGALEAMIEVARRCLEQGELERGYVHLHRLIDIAADHPEVEELIAAYSGGDEPEGEGAAEPAEVSIRLDIEEVEAPARARFERPPDDPFFPEPAPEAAPLERRVEAGTTHALDGALELDVPEGDEEIVVPADDLEDEELVTLPEGDETPSAGPALAIVPEEPPSVAEQAPEAATAAVDTLDDDDLLLVGEGDGADEEILEAWDGGDAIVLTEEDITAGPAAEERTVAFPGGMPGDDEIVEEPWAEAALEFAGSEEPVGLGAKEQSEIESELAEGAFFLEQGYLAEAEETFRAVLAKVPGNELAQRLLDQALQMAREGTPRSAADVEPPPPTVLARLPPTPGSVKVTEPMFSPGTDSQFDLAAELASELDSLGPAAERSNEFQYSVDDVLAEFKRGVSQVVSAEDTDTHYDLGIAYKEMGLLADAVAEFTIARQACIGKKKELDCLTMAGMCEALQGKHDRAIEAFLAALGCESVTPDAAKALHFEIGLSFEALGDLASANTHFRKVAHVDPSYRDVAVAVSRTEASPPPAPGRKQEGRGKL